MKVVVQAYELAQEFWTAVGYEGEFPRTLEEAIPLACAITIKRLPALTLGAVRDWLAPQGIVVDVEAERRLRGCLASPRGGAFLFLDAEDPLDEQRYTLAHELAHFLRDVLRPRRRIESFIGSAALEVYDAIRSASPRERLLAALEGVSLTARLHFLARGIDGAPATAAIAEAEDEADELAFELLAPAAHIATRADAWSRSDLIERLAVDYGLPRREAERYAEQLRPSRRRKEAWVRAMRRRFEEYHRG